MNAPQTSHALVRLRNARALVAISACVWLLTAQQSGAQLIMRRATSNVGTMSNLIYSDALALRSAGNFLVSAAIARNLHAEAASKEMDNSVKWVSTYFERRRLNREARAEEHPGYVERLERRKELYHRVIAEGLPALGTDLSDDLNLMLREILAITSYSAFMSDAPNSAISSERNESLSPDEIHHIRVGEAGLVGGKALLFRVDTGEILETRWPPALREKQFEAARKAFEDARDAALADMRADRAVSDDSRKRLMSAVDGLTVELRSAYPPERRKAQGTRDGMALVDAQNCLRSLALSTYRLIETESALAFDRSFRFQGKSVSDLLQHVAGKGLEFAPAAPGGEATYQKLFTCVRGYYLELVPDPSKGN